MITEKVAAVAAVNEQQVDTEPVDEAQCVAAGVKIATAAGVRRPGDRSIYHSIYLTTVDPNEWPTCNLGVRCGRCGGAARGHA